MFAEAEAPHHVAHFHAYYQENVAIYTIDPLELIGGGFPSVSSALWKLGPNCIGRNCLLIGGYWNKAGDLAP